MSETNIDQLRAERQDAMHEAMAKYISAVGSISERETRAFEMGFLCGTTFGLGQGVKSFATALEAK